MDELLKLMLQSVEDYGAYVRRFSAEAIAATETLADGRTRTRYARSGAIFDAKAKFRDGVTRLFDFVRLAYGKDMARDLETAFDAKCRLGLDGEPFPEENLKAVFDLVPRQLEEAIRRRADARSALDAFTSHMDSIDNRLANIEGGVTANGETLVEVKAQGDRLEAKGEANAETLAKVGKDAATAARMANGLQNPVDKKTAAKLCGVTERTIRNWIAGKRTPRGWPGLVSFEAVNTFAESYTAYRGANKAIQRHPERYNENLLRHNPQ